MAGRDKPPKKLASAGSEAAQLRRDIDGGITGDKVAWPDPAAAPLGTDDEAAGSNLSASTISDARHSEVAAEVTKSRTSAWVFPSAAFVSLILLLIVGAWWALS